MSANQTETNNTTITTSNEDGKMFNLGVIVGKTVVITDKAINSSLKEGARLAQQTTGETVDKAIVTAGAALELAALHADEAINNGLTKLQTMIAKAKARQLARKTGQKVEVDDGKGFFAGFTTGKNA